MTDQPSIEESDNGPLIVKNLTSFKMPDGTEVDGKPVMALCRCGASKNKPFCDGSHTEAGFDSTHKDVSHRDRIYDYQGAEVTVHFNKLLCVHAGECGKRARAIFNTKQRPWVQPDAGTLDQVKEVVAACPSGALRYSENGSAPQEITNDAPSLSVERNGSYHVENIIVEADFWATGQSDKKYALCRCGMSQNKPFCDGTHYDKGWTDGAE